MRVKSGHRRLVAVLALAGTCMRASAFGDGEPSAVVALIRGACGSGEAAGVAVLGRLQGLSAQPPEPLVVRGRGIGSRQRFVVPGGGEYLLERVEPGGRLRQVRLTYAEPWRAGVRPKLLALADGSCVPRSGRRLVYGDGPAPVAIERLDARLGAVEAREPLDPAVPSGADFPGVTVALVDSGVNYLLPGIRSRLARDSDGRSLGYDFWDLDERPFDANPVASAFFPQRHGTQTASVLLEEAPLARLLPYRYPRPDMGRMVDLVEHAAAAGAAIVNVSMGSRHRSDWEPFARAVAGHPGMLFIVSAGNDGRDLDERPVYPAALALENLIAVTSALADGHLASGSNWGRRGVDVAIPAEEVVGSDFLGRPKLLAGSSYAAARLSALAACLLAAHPSWRAAELKAALFDRARPFADASRAYVSQGFVPDPTGAPRGACASTGRPPTVTSVARWALPVPDDTGVRPALRFRPTLVIPSGAGWDADAVRRAIGEAASILAQCGVTTPEVEVRSVDVPRRYRYFHERLASQLLGRLSVPKPAVFFVADTLQARPFAAEAIGRSNARGREALLNTVWITAGTQHPGISLAHEIVHVLADSGQHDPDPDNLMHEETRGDNTRLRDGQCMRMVQVGQAFGLLEPVP